MMKDGEAKVIGRRKIWISGDGIINEGPYQFARTSVRFRKKNLLICGMLITGEQAIK